MEDFPTPELPINISLTKQSCYLIMLVNLLLLLKQLIISQYKSNLSIFCINNEITIIYKLFSSNFIIILKLKLQNMSLSTIAYREIDTIVSSWTQKYQHHISLLQSKDKFAKFMVEFSLPKPAKPIPIGTVRVYFTASINEDNIKTTTFRFQKDSLIHTIDQTIRHKEIQKWIDDALSKKLLVRQTVFYLGTTYEETRVKDPRLDKIMQEQVIVDQPEYVYIHPDLLSDQKRSIQIMQQPSLQFKDIEKNVITHFRQLDKQNIGVITHPQFTQILNNLGITLNEQQTSQVFKRVDPENTGTVQYDNYKQIVMQIIQAMYAKKSAQENLYSKRDQEIFGSILTLINDEVQDIQDEILKYFKQKDQDETGLTNITQVKGLLQKINKSVNAKSKPQNPKQLFTAIQLAQIAKILTEMYGYKTIPYKNIHKNILDFKISSLTQGRINSQMNNLQVYLRELFDPYDDKKFGVIRLEQMIKALNDSPKIKLSRAQIYLLKNIVPTNEKGEIKYIQTSKFLSELIKKFYIHSSKKKQ